MFYRFVTCASVLFLATRGLRTCGTCRAVQHWRYLRIFFAMEKRGSFFLSTFRLRVGITGRATFARTALRTAVRYFLPATLLRHAPLPHLPPPHRYRSCRLHHTAHTVCHTLPAILFMAFILGPWCVCRNYGDMLPATLGIYAVAC
jgi:hypothetical protein